MWAMLRSRLLKKAHLLRWRARAALRGTVSVRLAPAPILRMGTRRAALYLDLFEQPGKKRVFQDPARPEKSEADVGTADQYARSTG
jgi:hypothetical protein